MEVGAQFIKGVRRFLEVYRELLFSSLFLLLRVQGLLQRTLLQFDLVN